MTEQTPLSDVTLTMIVRDELMNPAGGLHAVLSRHLPYFQDVVVLDTGSVDGTRQLLEQMASEYSQLRVYDAEFKGYGHARVTANQFVKTKYTLMLDADEMFGSPQQLVDEIGEFSGSHLRFDLIDVYPDGKTVQGCSGWNPRLFKPDLVVIKGAVWELAYPTKKVKNPALLGGKAASTEFFHFLPREEDTLLKINNWYNRFSFFEKDSTYPGESPSQIPSYNLWKTPNPRTLLKYGIDVQEEIKKLERLGLRVDPQIMVRLQQYREGQ